MYSYKTSPNDHDYCLNTLQCRQETEILFTNENDRLYRSFSMSICRAYFYYKKRRKYGESVVVNRSVESKVKINYLF